MRHIPSPEQIIEDIEFELMQGISQSDDLSQGVRALERYQNKLRSETFGSATLPNRELLGRLFRFNDMLIALLLRMSMVLQEQGHALRRIGQARAGVYQGHEQISSPGNLAVSQNALQDSDMPRAEYISEIEQAMHSDTIHIDLQARLARLPVIGWLVGPLQIFLHRPALFYVRLLADRQAPINRAFGDWILRLNESQTQYAAQIEHLKAQIAMLEQQLDQALQDSKK